MNQLDENWKNFFQTGGVKDKNGVYISFSSMSSKEKKEYVSKVLFLLLEDFPDDNNIRKFVALGTRELTRTQTQKIIFLLSSQKVYITSFFLSVLLFLNFSGMPYSLPSRKHEPYTTEEKMI